MTKVFWFLSIARNAMVVVLCATAAFFAAGNGLFRLVESVDKELPSVSLPPFGSSHQSEDGETVRESFLQMLGNVGGLLVVLPVVSILQHMAIVKAFGKKKKSEIRCHLHNFS